MKEIMAIKMVPMINCPLWRDEFQVCFQLCINVTVIDVATLVYKSLTGCKINKINEMLNFL